MPRTARLHRLAAAPAVASAVLAAAAPAAADPTIGADRPCYSPGDVIAVQGEGYTPGSPVDVSFTGATTGTMKFASDAGGLLRAQVRVRESDADAFIPSERTQTEITLAAVDRAVAEAADGRVAGASATFLLSHFATYADRDLDALRPSRPLSLATVGFTHDVGRTMYLHYVRRGKRVATRRFGVLEGPCGDAQRRLARAFPFRRVEPGRWTLVLNLSKTDPKRRPSAVLPARTVR